MKVFHWKRVTESESIVNACASNSLKYHLVKARTETSGNFLLTAQSTLKWQKFVWFSPKIRAVLSLFCIWPPCVTLCKPRLVPRQRHFPLTIDNEGVWKLTGSSLPNPKWRWTVTSDMRTILHINLTCGSKPIIELVPGGRGSRHVGRTAD